MAQENGGQKGNAADRLHRRLIANVIYNNE
jgi:hypothetical protein